MKFCIRSAKTLSTRAKKIDLGSLDKLVITHQFVNNLHTQGYAQYDLKFKILIYSLTM